MDWKKAVRAQNAADHEQRLAAKRLTLKASWFVGKAEGGRDADLDQVKRR
jgi:hypothetical protein